MSIFVTKKDKDLQRIDRKLEDLAKVLEKILRYLEKMDTYVSPELEAEIKEAARLTKQIDNQVKDK